MKKLFLTSATFIFIVGNLVAQIIGTGSMTVTVTGSDASACTPPCDGAAKADVLGGTPPYTYRWSTTPTQSTQVATGLCPGSYTVLVTDASGGISSGSVGTVTITCGGTSAGLALTTSTTQATVCTAPCNGTATANATGGTPPYTYAWGTTPSQTTQTATGLCPGTYSEGVKDAASGQAVASVTVTCAGIAPGTLTLSISSSQATLCTAPCNGVATVNTTGGTPPYAYSWSTNPVQATQSATGLCPGTYTVTVTDSGSPSPTQGKQTVTITCNSANGINSLVVDENISVFPNPAHGELNVQFNSSLQGKVTVSVSGTLGSEVYRNEFMVKGATSKLIDISGLPAGIYSIQFITEQALIVKQFIKQ